MHATHTQLTWDGRPQDPEERTGFDNLLSTLMGWCLALMPTFTPKHTAKVLLSLGKLELYSEEVRVCLCFACACVSVFCMCVFVCV